MVETAGATLGHALVEGRAAQGHRDAVFKLGSLHECYTINKCLTHVFIGCLSTMCLHRKQ